MSEAAQQREPAQKRLWWHGLHPTSTRRALLLTALGGLLIAGVTVALPTGTNDPARLIGYVGANGATGNNSRASATLNSAHIGDCLNWPNKAPDQATVVSCRDDHRFEVAAAVDMRTFPGSEYGPNAAAPTPGRIQQISQEQCQGAVKRYLGTKYDPNGRFTISMLWSGDKAWSQSGDRRMLCGLQLPGAGNQQQPFKGKVADLDQSRVWAAGTCLGIENTTNQPTDIPIDCTGPHAMEVTGSVNLAEKFPDALPPEAQQDTFVKDACTRMTDAYLAPVPLRTTTLTLIYSTISLPSWSAGSHQVSCSVGATLGNGGWATLIGPAKGPLLINGQPPVVPPDIPEERLTLPPINLPIPLPGQIPGQIPGQLPGTIDASGTQSPQNRLTPPAIGNQHLPNAPGPQVIDIGPPSAGDVPVPGGPPLDAPPGAPPPAGLPPPGGEPAPAQPPPAVPAPAEPAAPPPPAPAPVPAAGPGT